MLHGRIARLHVYAASPSAISTPTPAVGWRFCFCEEVELHSLQADREFCARQLERLGRFGASFAYAVHIGDALAHISWLLPVSVLSVEEPRVFRARANEAEITACETLPEFRGMGVYPFAIRQLCSVAREQGVERVFMKTRPENQASQAGIEKAGLRRVGSAWLISVPKVRREVVVRLFR